MRENQREIWHTVYGNEFEVGKKPGFPVISKLVIFLLCLGKEVTCMLDVLWPSGQIPLIELSLPALLKGCMDL